MLWGLKLLNIRGCTSISDTGCTNLPKLKYMEELDLSGLHQLTDSSLSYIGKLITLRKLDVSHCSITDNGIWIVCLLPTIFHFCQKPGKFIEKLFV